MQAIKEKLHDMGEMRKAKAEAKEEEKAQVDLAKARMEIAHEVRLAKEAEAAMDLHVNKAAEKAVAHEQKHSHPTSHQDVPTGMPPATSICPGGLESTPHQTECGAGVDKQTVGHNTGASTPPSTLLD